MREHGSNGAKMYAEMPVALLRQMLRVLDEEGEGHAAAPDKGAARKAEVRPAEIFPEFSRNFPGARGGARR